MQLLHLWYHFLHHPLQVLEVAYGCYQTTRTAAEHGFRQQVWLSGGLAALCCPVRGCAALVCGHRGGRERQPWACWALRGRAPGDE